MKLRPRKEMGSSIPGIDMGVHSSARNSLFWISSKNKKTAICDMDTNYIKNCINKIKREDIRFSLSMEVLITELLYRDIQKKQKKDEGNNN